MVSSPGRRAWKGSSRVGLEHAKALWALSEMGLKYVRTAIAEARRPGVAPIAGWLKVSKVDNGDEVLAAVQLYGDGLGAEVEGWPTERVRDVLKSNHYFHAMHLPRAFHIHPLNYALGLAEAAEAAGARIFEDTPALSIDVEGVRKRISTPSARVRAAHIVLACNVHLGTLVPRIVGTLLPIWSYVITTAPLGPRLADAVAYRGAVTDTDLANSHYRVVDGDRLLWSGHSTTWEAEPKKFAKRLQADIAEIYPQLGEVAVEHVWSGVLGNALHRMPQIGELSPGLGCERLRRPPQPDGHGGQHPRPGDRRGRRHRGCSRRSSWLGRRPIGRAMQVYTGGQRPRTLRGACGPPARAGIPARRRARGAARGGGAGGRGSAARRGGAAGTVAGGAGIGRVAARSGARARGARRRAGERSERPARQLHGTRAERVERRARTRR